MVKMANFTGKIIGNHKHKLIVVPKNTLELEGLKTGSPVSAFIMRGKMNFYFIAKLANSGTSVVIYLPKFIERHAELKLGELVDMRVERQFRKIIYTAKSSDNTDDRINMQKKSRR